MKRIVIGVSGASGIILAYKATQALINLGYFVELVFTTSALYASSLELENELRNPQKWLSHFPKNSLKVHSIQDVGSSIASGSYSTEGMLIIPCSMATLAAISVGLADNCLRRAADVMLKERRPLVIVPRETPLNEIHLEHMLRLTKMGAIIVPPVPAWYNNPKTLEDVENFIVGKSLDALKISNDLYPRWKS